MGEPKSKIALIIQSEERNGLIVKTNFVHFKFLYMKEKRSFWANLGWSKQREVKVIDDGRAYFRDCRRRPLQYLLR